MWQKKGWQGCWWVMALALGLQGCTMTTAKLNIGKALHLPWETAAKEPEPAAWDGSLTTVKVDENDLVKQPPSRDNDPVGRILRDKGWEQPRVRWSVERYDYDVRNRVKADFEAAGIPYPPARLAMLAFKKERKLELWAADGEGEMKRVKNYPFTAFSGELGPKRRAGDGQIPEGIYRIAYLNPESAYHLSMKLNYPNEFDREMAAREKRTNLGGDIFIHGDARSIGCIAVGNTAIEELFVLTALAGPDNARVIVAPYDLRQQEDIRTVASIPWTRELYANIQRSLAAFPSDGTQVVAMANP